MKRFCGALLAGLLSGTVAAAQSAEGDVDALFPQQLSARTLLTYCASSSITDRGRQRQRYCAGFISGVEESLRLLQKPDGQGRFPALCASANTTARELQDAYVRYAARSDADLTRPAALVAFEALAAAYACREDQPR
jgi:hypothetical protein